MVAGQCLIYWTLSFRLGGWVRFFFAEGIIAKGISLKGLWLKGFQQGDFIPSDSICIYTYLHKCMEHTSETFKACKLKRSILLMSMSRQSCLNIISGISISFVFSYFFFISSSGLFSSTKLISSVETSKLPSAAVWNCSPRILR